MYKKMNNQEKILSLLFVRPTYRFHLREMARETKLNPNTIINITNKLEKLGFVKKEKKKNLVEVYLNLDKKEIIQEKRIFNLRKIYESGIIDFLTKMYSPLSISILGSYSRGEDIEISDIDIVLFSEKKHIIDLNKFEKELNRKIHLLIPSKNDISKEFFNNLINGVVVYGAIQK
jgi:predicted nucleotidyltransferase